MAKELSQVRKCCSIAEQMLQRVLHALTVLSCHRDTEKGERESQSKIYGCTDNHVGTLPSCVMRASWAGLGVSISVM